MTKLKSLKRMASARREAYSPAEIHIAIDNEKMAEEAVPVLMRFFGEDDNRQVVCLLSGGQRIGYLVRDDLYGFVADSLKSVGHGDHSLLPGSADFKLLELRCKRKNCKERMAVILFDEDHPPKCPKHPDVNMGVR